MVRNVYTADKSRHVAHGGEGIIETSRVFVDSDFRSKLDFVDHSVVPPGVTIGLHTHGNDEEMYYIIEGKALMIIDGKEVEVSRGDLILNCAFGTHGLTNHTDSPVEILVFQVSI